jgi:hypothetical protein
VFLQIILDGVEHGYSVGYVVRESFDTPPANKFTLVRAIARLLIGNKRSDLTYDRFDSMNSIAFPDSCAQIKKIGVRVVRPDGTLYNFHSNPFSVSLALTFVDRPGEKK